MKIINWVRSLFSKESYLLEDGTLNVKVLMRRTLTFTVTILALYLLVIKLITFTPLGESEVLKQFILDFGVQGVALYVYLVDLLVLPLSVDFIWAFVMAWSPFKAILEIGRAHV